jgi:hypothetical protein
MEKNPGETIAAKIVEGVKTALAEIDELRVQLALGKAEAKELYEINKKRFHASVQEIENTFRELRKDEAILPLVNAMETLRVQLALGKAETKELFEEQYDKIHKALNHIELELKNNKTISENYAHLHLELEKFKIKLELFALHYKLKKISAQFDFENRKAELAEKLDDIKAKMLLKQKEGKQKWENFQVEINEAYNHLKSAFNQ